MRRAFIGLTVLGLLVGVASPALAADPAPPFRPPLRQDRERIAPAARATDQGVAAAPSLGGLLNSLIAYSFAPYGAWPAGVWTIDPATSAVDPLTPGGIGQGDNQPAWSPGGTMIAFLRDTTSSTADQTSDIWTMNADGTGLRRLTNTAAAEYSPAWSPDGSRIVFSSNRSGNFEIYTMNIDGTAVRRLTYHGAIDDMPAWSPDGTQIAFASDRSGNADIWKMNANGTSPVRLTTSPSVDMEPAWAPYLPKIAFTSNRTGDYDIFVMGADGSTQTNRTLTPGSWDFEPTYSPDGLDIAYYGDGFGDLDIYAVAAGGGVPESIAYTYDDEFAPSWQPVPEFPLVDAAFSPFEADIKWVYGEGITSGCSAERYCPNDPVTREQMASFLVRALDLPSTTSDFFTDDETSIHESNINRVAAAGITTGCTATTYCPKAVVTREQMASFLARALDLPSTTSDFFTDDETSVHEVNINRVAAADITSGCTATTYCPTQIVTRGQMAAFLHRAVT